MWDPVKQRVERKEWHISCGCLITTDPTVYWTVHPIYEFMLPNKLVLHFHSANPWLACDGYIQLYILLLNCGGETALSKCVLSLKSPVSQEVIYQNWGDTLLIGSRLHFPSHVTEYEIYLEILSLNTGSKSMQSIVSLSRYRKEWQNVTQEEDLDGKERQTRS
jgi:hypothetical protein